MYYKNKLVIIITILALLFSGIPINDFAYAEGEPVFTSISLIATTTVDGVQSMMYQIYGRNFVDPTFWIDGRTVSSNGYEVVDGAYLIIRNSENSDFFESGTHEIIVQNNDGIGEDTEIFTAKIAPWVTSISASKVNVGDELTIYGTGFDSEITSLFIGGNPYSSSEYTILNSGTIKVDSVKAAQFPRNGDIKIVKEVTETSGEIHQIQGIYKGAISIVGTLDDIVVERLEPNTGPVDGGTEVRIIGQEENSAFRADMKIYIDKVTDKNRFTNVQLITDETTQDVIGISGITPKSPTNLQGVFPVIITDNTGANELIIPNAFTYEDKDNLLRLSTITPPYGKGTAEEDTVQITGRNMVSLNVSNLVDWTVNEDVYNQGRYYDFEKNSLVVNYKGKYKVDAASDYNVNITREIKLILGKTTEILRDFESSPAIDKITAKIPSVTEPGPVNVTMQTTTTLRYINGNQLIFTRNEEYTLNNGFTFLPATTKPIIEKIEPSKGPVNELIYLTIKGKDFQVLSETDPDTGVVETKYPIIYIGNKEINPNMIDGDDGSIGFNPDWVKIYDDSGNEVNGIGRLLGTTIKTAIPAHGDNTTVGVVNVRIVNPDKGESDFTDDPKKKFEFLNPQREDNDLPIINRISPSMGPLEGGNQITIEGENFDFQAINPQVIVTIDGQEAEIVNASSIKIDVVVPPGITIGEKNLQVITEDGAIATNDNNGNGYTYVRKTANPEILKVSPSFGGKDTVVYIFAKDKGEENPNFFAPKPSGARIEEKIGTRVFLNDIDINDKEEYDGQGNLIEASLYNKINGEITADSNGNVFYGTSRVTVIDRNTLRITIPGGYSAGLKDLTILNPDTSGVTIAKGFNYKIPPENASVQINVVDPDFGSHKGGNYVTLIGQDFKEGARVYFGGHEASYVDVSEGGDKIYLSTPVFEIPNPDIDASIPVDVTVVNYDGSSATLEEGYTYMVPESEPLINKIDPSFGSTIGNRYVSIEGRDFRKTFDSVNNVTVLPKVYFGGNESKDVIYMGDTELYVKVPFRSEEGSVDVTVINPDAGTASKANGFSYRMSKPTIEEVIPGKGHKLGGLEIIVRGKELLQGDFTEELAGEQLDGEDTIMNVLAIFGDERDEEIVIPRSEGNIIVRESENILEDVSIDYKSIRSTPVTTHDGDTTTDSVLIYHKDIEAPIAHYDLKPEERHLFIIDWDVILDDKLSEEGIMVELRDDTLSSIRRIAPRAEVLDAEEGATITAEIQTPPAAYIGNKNLYIENKDRGFATSTFEYVSPDSSPVIEEITPRSEIKNPQGDITKYYVESTVEGGLYITIEGYDFRQNIETFIDGTPASLVSRVVLPETDDQGRPKTRIVVKAPKGRIEDVNKEMRIMLVNQDGGFADSSLLPVPYYFVYRIPESSPIIESVLPVETSQAGGNQVRILGYDFRTGAKVIIGGRESAVNSINNEEILVTTPTDLTPGLKDIQVINRDYGTVTKFSAITIVSYPEVTRITTEGGQLLNRVSIEGGAQIVISGRGFQNGAKVIIGGNRKIIGSNGAGNYKGLFKDDKYYDIVNGIEAKKVEYVSENKLVVTLPEVLDEGDYVVSVLNTDGGLSNNDQVIQYSVPIPSDPIGLQVEIVNDKYIRIFGYSSAATSYYEIYAYLGDDRPDDKDFKYLDTTDKTSYRITKLREIDDDEDLYIKIRAVNEYGPSSWSDAVRIRYSVLEDIDQIGDEDEDGDLTSKYSETIGSDGINILIGDSGLRGSDYSNYNIDLRGSKYSSINRRVINIPVKLIKESNRTILVDNGDSRIQFSPYNFFFSVNSTSNVTYGKLIIEKLLGIYNDQIAIKIPRKYKSYSKIYSIGAAVQAGRDTKYISSISGSMDIELIYDEQLVQGIDENKLQIFTFNPDEDKWVPLAGGVDTAANRVYARIQKPGQFIILGER